MSSANLSLDWATFCKAYCEFNSTDIYGYDYPSFEEEVDSMDDCEDLFIAYIDKALDVEGVSPSQALKDYLQANLNSSRFLLEGEDLKRVVPYLLSKGAIFPEELILGPNYKEEYVYRDYMLPGREMVKVSYDDEFMNYRIKGRILDIIQTMVPLPGVDAIDWTKVKAEYWEYLADDDSVDVDAPITDELRWRVLKSESKYLLEKFPCPGDNSESYPSYNKDDDEDEDKVVKKEDEEDEDDEDEEDEDDEDEEDEDDEDEEDEDE